MSGIEHRLLDGGVIDVGAVGGTEIAHEDTIGFNFEFTMEARDCRIGDAEVVGGVASDADEALGEFETSGKSLAVEH